MRDTLWLTTAELCAHLAISRSTLFAIRRSGLLKDGRHLVAKNPQAPVLTSCGSGSVVSWPSGGSADELQQQLERRLAHHS